MENLLLSAVVVLVSCVCGGLLLLFRRHRAQFAYRNIPPGTSGYPIFGESLEMAATRKKGEPEKFFFDRTAKYKTEVFTTSIVGEPAAAFCSAAGNKLLFSNEGKLVTPWWPESAAKVFPSAPGPADQEAVETISLLPQFIRPEALKRYVGVMDSMAQLHFASHWDNKSQILVAHTVKYYTFGLACRLFMGVEDPEEVERILERFEEIGRGTISVPIDFPGTLFRKGIKASEFVRGKIMKIVKQRKAEMAEGKASGNQDILSHMLQLTNEEDASSKILGLLVGGHDTTVTACIFIVKFLASNPHVYQNVYDEQTEIARSKAAGELLNWEDIQKMKYSWNVICEVLRLTPPVQGAFRVALKDFVFDGFNIPKGWKILWSATATHRSAAYFPEPYKFDPTRFEGKGPAPFTFVPFGGGPRMCPGKEYARLELLVFMHHLVTRFSFQLCIPDEKVTSISIFTPVHGLPVRLFRHAPPN
ncbi:beta-amyrin 28-oxidase-like [Momordica charantia]|uniref:Beta-amyrin 28-oxidase-like n=1 Tax=Momordica charantia TaxID=3673 RepID=A0A6J1C2F1_MOMCH|nr:beta-amyrin 28-oxidase-like [Momordica charantia]